MNCVTCARCVEESGMIAALPDGYALSDLRACYAKLYKYGREEMQRRIVGQIQTYDMLQADVL